ncbi:hypothetical protein PMAYCL1PPCAC_10811, partial [Pristionchus mayeri]
SFSGANDTFFFLHRCCTNRISSIRAARIAYFLSNFPLILSCAIMNLKFFSNSSLLIKLDGVRHSSNCARDSPHCSCFIHIVPGPNLAPLGSMSAR